MLVTPFVAKSSAFILAHLLGRRPRGPFGGGWDNAGVNPPADPAALRRSYESGELTEAALADSWLAQLRRWYDEAAADDRIGEPNAMQVATVDEAGRPDVRTV